MDRTKRMAGDLQPRQKHYEAEMKFRILYLSEQKNTDPGEIATAFGISRNTPHNWRNAYDEKGMAGLEDAPRSGRRPFVSDADAKKCRDAAREEHGLVTRDRMRDKIRGNC
ncbi:MAG: helix-turn-helix domain-containing protein [Thaumarchaeota archaeon]|nr:helix-turn-helix domain-containing protein [Nitrososphaerota archaeon]